MGYVLFYFTDRLFHISSLLGGIASCSTSDSAYSYTFLHSVVCLLSVCHTRASCLIRSIDLDAIWQVHLWGPVTHCVRCVRDLQGEGEILQLQPNRQSCAATWRMQFHLLRNYFGPCFHLLQICCPLCDCELVI